MALSGNVSTSLQSQYIQVNLSIGVWAEGWRQTEVVYAKRGKNRLLQTRRKARPVVLAGRDRMKMSFSLFFLLFHYLHFRLSVYAIRPFSHAQCQTAL